MGALRSKPPINYSPPKGVMGKGKILEEIVTNLSTTYLGLELKSPLVVSSNPLTIELDQVQRLAAAGAGAVILPSLFEEQLQLEDSGWDRIKLIDGRTLPGSVLEMPNMTGYNKGSVGYLAALHQIKKEVDIQVIASLNGTTLGGWTRYARILEAAGADAIELNIYHLPIKPWVSGSELEDRYVRLVEGVKNEVSVPVSVKLNPYFSSLPHTARKLFSVGAAGLVLFNRFYQPDFDLDTEQAVARITYSEPDELLLRLRWVSLLYGHVQGDLAITGGVHSGRDLLKSLMAGARVGMVASAVLKNGVDHVKSMLDEAQEWLAGKGIEDVNEIRGRMSLQRIRTPYELVRANYMEVLDSHPREFDTETAIAEQ